MFRNRIAAAAGVSLLLCLQSASGGPFEDGFTAYDEGDIEGAVELWQRAAELGHEVAHYNLGVVYSDALTLPYDPDLGLRHYVWSAEAGYRPGAVMAGSLYREQGEFRSAIRLLDRAFQGRWLEEEESNEYLLDAWQQGESELEMLYESADLCPEVSGWESAPMTFSRDNSYPAMAYFAYQITATRMYFIPQTERMVLCAIHINDPLEMNDVIEGFHGRRTPSTRTLSDEELDANRADGAKPYRYDGYIGLENADPAEPVRVLLVHRGERRAESVVYMFAGSNISETELDDFVDATNFEGAAALLSGHAYYSALDLSDLQD